MSVNTELLRFFFFFPSRSLSFSSSGVSYSDEEFSVETHSVMIGLTLEKTGDNDGPLDDKNVQSKDINILYQGLQSLAAILLEKEKVKLFYAYSAA